MKVILEGAEVAPMELLEVEIAFFEIVDGQFVVRELDEIRSVDPARICQ